MCLSLGAFVVVTLHSCTLHASMILGASLPCQRQSTKFPEILVLVGPRQTFFLANIKRSKATSLKQSRQPQNFVFGENLGGLLSLLKHSHWQLSSLGELVPADVRQFSKPHAPTLGAAEAP